MNTFTHRQRRFIEAYAGDATQAAIMAGYSSRTAAATASRLLRDVKIREAVKTREAENLRPMIADRDERLAFWSGVMRGEGRGEGGVPRLADRLKASELLAKASGDFLPQTMKVDLNSTGNAGIEAMIALAQNPEEYIKAAEALEAADKKYHGIEAMIALAQNPEEYAKIEEEPLLGEEYDIAGKGDKTVEE